MTREIFLLDIDSVLVRPLGYREALRATVDHFGLRMNREPGSISPTYDEIEVFEANGFGCEWDSIPVCLAAFFALASEQGAPVWRETLTGTMVLIARSPVQFPRPDYAGCVRRIAAEQAESGKPVAARALDYFLAHTRREKSEPVLRELLTDTPGIRAPTTRTFQHYTLGGWRFSQTYGFGPDFEVESYLQTRDKPLLTPEGRARLVEAGVPYAVYTARPSYPPPGVDSFGYSPEAEMACELVGLDEAPLIGFGHVSWLAQQAGVHLDAYTKPSPVQALAAIGAAWGGEVKAALWAARELVEEGTLSGPLAALAGEPVRVTVFEDAPGGMKAVFRAAEVLRAAGLDVEVRGVGIATHAAKREALAPLAAHLTGDVNAGLRWALNATRG